MGLRGVKARLGYNQQDSQLYYLKSSDIKTFDIEAQEIPSRPNHLYIQCTTPHTNPNSSCHATPAMTVTGSAGGQL